MKINSLLESTVASDPSNSTNSAPVMGRSDKFLEEKDETVEECTTSGSVASVDSPVGGMQRRGKGSMFAGIKTSSKYPNSKAVKEAQLDEVDPRNFDSDVDYYAAQNAPAKVRSNSRPSPGVNQDDEAYFREIFRKKRLAAQQAERSADHDRLATGTNEGLESDSELKSWQVVIMNNYYRGKYSDYGGRYYYVLASSPEEAKQVVLDNADGILQDLLSMKSHNGKKILPRGSAVRITPERIGKIEDGTVAGRMSTAGYKKMFGPQGLMMVKLSGGAIVDIQDESHGTMGLNASLEQHADDRMKELGHKFKPVGEARKANTASSRAEFGKRPRKEDPVEQDKKKAQSDEAWARLMAYADAEKKKEQGVAEGAPELLKAEMPLVRHIEQELTNIGYKKGTPEFNAYFNDAIKFYRQFGNFGFNKEQGVAEGSPTMWEVCFDYGPHMSDTVKVKASSEDEAIAKVEKAAEKRGRSIDINWAKPAEQGVAEAKMAAVSRGRRDGQQGKPLAPPYHKDSSDYHEYSKGWNEKEDIRKKHNLAPYRNKDVAEASFDYTMKDLGNDYAGFPSQHSLKHKFLAKIKPEKQQLYKDKMNNTRDWDSLFALFKVAKERGDIVEQAVAEEKQRLDPKCWKGYKKQGTKMKGDTRVNNCVPVSEAEVSEDKLANDLYKDLQIFKKGADKDIGSKAKDKGISSKAKDKEIVAKEGFGDAIKKKAKQFSKYMTEPNSPHNDQVRSRAKNIANIRKQEEKKSVFEKDPEAMREFERSGGYEAGIDVMGWQVGWAAAKHAQGDTMKEAFQKLYYGGGASFPFSQKAFKLAWVAYNKHYGPQGNLEEMDGNGVGRDGSTDAEKKEFTAKPITSQQAQDKALDTLKQVLSKPETMNVLKRLKNK